MKAAPMKVKKAKRVSIVARGKYARAAVFRGTKDMFIKNKSGRVVSKAASARSKKAFAQSAVKKWCDACQQARKQLGISGFCAVGGKTAQGKALYAKAKAILGR